MLKSTLNKGFQMEFKNGYEISIQFGNGNYCDNNLKENSNYITTCNNAEVAIFYKNKNVTKEVLCSDYDFVSYVDADKVAELINVVKNLI